MPLDPVIDFNFDTQSYRQSYIDKGEGYMRHAMTFSTDEQRKALGN